jgi:drug/metabolite transporter (DMT)-like permease
VTGDRLSLCAILLVVDQMVAAGGKIDQVCRPLRFRGLGGGSRGCACRSQRYSRRYGPKERADASATLATVVGTVAATPFLPVEWVTPSGGWHWALFAGMGVMAGVGHYFLTIAYSQAPAAVVAPVNYVQLVGAALLGYLVFGDIPDAWSGVGAGVIVASGLYIGHRERIRHRLSQQMPNKK